MKLSVLSLALASATVIAVPAFAQDADITIGDGVFPESIASTPDGALLIGSFTQSIVYRVAPGATVAEPWITTGVGPIITGVFASGDTVYVCSNGAFGSNEATLKTFDLATAAETGSFAFPEGGFCSDTAVGPDGTVYVSSLNFSGGPGQLLKLEGGALEVLLSDAAIAGIDGIAFLGETLYANNLMTGELLRVNLGDGAATTTALTLSEPLNGPDGMRTTEDGTALLIAEQYAGRIVTVTVDGDNATVTEVATGFAGPAGVAQIGDKAYVVEAHFDAMQAGTDPGTFVVHPVSLGM